MGEARGIAYAVMSAACFAMLPILGKLAFERGFGAAEIMQYRFGFGALLLLVWYAATDRAVLRIRRGTLLKTAFLGVGFYPAQSLCFMSAIEYIPAATASLILYFYPLMVTLLSALVFKSRLNRIMVLSLGLLIAGCGLVFYDAFARDINSTGLVLALASMLIFSVYLVLVEVMLKGENPRTFSFYCLLSAALAYTVMHPPLRFPQMDLTSQALTLGLGLIPTSLAVTLFFRAVECIGSAKASICSTFEPIITVIACALLLGESIAAVQVAGMALILAGIVLPNARALSLRRAFQRA